MSSEMQLPFADTFRDILALITAYIHTDDTDDTDAHGTANDLLRDVIGADPEHSAIVFLGITGALVHQLAEAQGFTDQEAWRHQATAYGAGLTHKENNQ